jgi:hypothetical protein
MDSPTNSHAHYLAVALWAQEMGIDCSKDGRQERAAGQGTLLQPSRPQHRQGHLDLRFGEETA